MVVRVENLGKVYGRKPALDGVSLAVAPGEIFGLLGQNGAGKTTLVRHGCSIARLEPPRYARRLVICRKITGFLNITPAPTCSIFMAPCKVCPALFVRVAFQNFWASWDWQAVRG